MASHTNTRTGTYTLVLTVTTTRPDEQRHAERHGRVPPMHVGDLDGTGQKQAGLEGVVTLAIHDSSWPGRGAT